MSRHYHGLLFTPMREPAIPKSTPMAPQPPYVGGELARLTSMTPFDGGQFSPVYMAHPKADAKTRLIFGGNPPPSQFYHGVMPVGGYSGTFNADSPDYGVSDAGVDIEGKLYKLKEYSAGVPSGLTSTGKAKWKEIVKVLQARLIQTGFMDATYRTSSGQTKSTKDGLYQGITKRAVKKFQDAVSQSKTGEINKATAKALWMYSQAVEAGTDPTEAVEIAKAHVAADPTTQAKIAEESGEKWYDDLGGGITNFFKDLRTPKVQMYRPDSPTPQIQTGGFPWGAAIFGTVALVGILAGFAYLKKED